MKGKNKRKLNILISANILSDRELSFNEKLILGLHYSLSKKRGYVSMTNVEIGKTLHLHPNIINYCHKSLIKKGFLQKEKRVYFLTDKLQELPNLSNDEREILLPVEIYASGLNTGAKLLWGEYNSLSKGINDYFAKRNYTARRLGASEQSITNWTKELEYNNLLSEYYHKSGYAVSQKVVVTCTFERKKCKDDLPED